MTTLELLTILQEQFKGWNINGDRGILPHLNAAHFMLLANESEQNVYYDETTGELPVLPTTKGTYKYDGDSNLWKIAGLYVRVEDISTVAGALISLTGFDYGSKRYTTRPIEYVTLAGLEYVRIMFARTYPATESNPPKIIFNEDPGDSDKYYVQYGYKKPTQIVSDTIQMDIAPPWDYEFLLPATAKLLEGIEHGNYVEARQYVMGTLKPLLVREMNGGEQGFDFEADNRGY